MSRIAVWNTAFLGDAVLTLPLIRTLRAAYPDAELDFWVRRGVGSLFAGQPEITNVYEYDKRGGQGGLRSAYSLGRQLARKHYTLWISAHTSPRSGLLARWSSARVRIGYAAPWLNRWFYTHLVDRRFDQLDEIERLLQLVKPLGIPSLLDWPELVLPDAPRAAAAAYWQDNVRGPVLGMHPGSVWATKRWTVDGFASIARRAADAGAQVMLFAGPGEVDVAREVANRAGLIDSPALLDVAGSLTLPELAAFLARLDCYLTNDSGPMHIAWAQRTPVTALFGPTVRRLGFFPRGAATTVIEANLDCRPCGLHGPQECPLTHHRCMTDISVDAVWQDVEGKLFAG